MRLRHRGFVNEASESRPYGRFRDLASVHIAEGRDIRLASCPGPPRGFYPCNTRSLAELVPTMGTRLPSWPGVTWVDGRSYAPPVSCHQRGPRSDRRQRAHTRLSQTTWRALRPRFSLYLRPLKPWPCGSTRRAGTGPEAGATSVSRSRGTDPIACPTSRSYCMNACKVKCRLPGLDDLLGAPVDWR